MKQAAAAGAWFRQLRGALGSAAAYGELARGLVVNASRRYPGATARVLAAGVGSLVCQVGALAVLFVYLRALERGTMLLGFAARDSMALFAMAGVATVLLFLGFSLLEYAAHAAILRVCRCYRDEGARRLLALARRLPHWFRPGGPGTISDAHLRQLLGNDLGQRSRMLRVLLRSIVPLGRLLVCAAAIFYVSATFSLMILLVVGLPLAGLYHVSRHIADTATERETERHASFPEQLSWLERRWLDTPRQCPASAGDADEPPLDDGSAERYFRRMRAKALGQLLLNTANTAGVLMLVILLGFWLSREPDGGWSLWATYLIALRYFFTSLSRVGQAIVQSSRFARQVRRLEDFLAAGERAAASADPRRQPCPAHVVGAFQGRSSSFDDGEEGDDD